MMTFSPTILLEWHKSLGQNEVSCTHCKYSKDVCHLLQNRSSRSIHRKQVELFEWQKLARITSQAICIAHDFPEPKSLSGWRSKKQWTGNVGGCSGFLLLWNSIGKQRISLAMKIGVQGSCNRQFQLCRIQVDFQAAGGNESFTNSCFKSWLFQNVSHIVKNGGNLDTVTIVWSTPKILSLRNSWGRICQRRFFFYL